MNPAERSVEEHYGAEDLTGGILSALRAAGKAPETLKTPDLAPVDQFHTGGRRATLDLALLAGLSPETRVLDVGGGLGGPARTLASGFGCRVEVLDITAEFCRSGRDLTSMVGLEELISFRHGSALEMPYPEASFDLLWTQHSTMNIFDKERLYREIHRVLRPGGRLAMHEVLAGDGRPVHLPVPWARDPEISHLRLEEETWSLISSAGLKELSWTDETAASAEWFRERSSRNTEDPQPLSLALILGPDLPGMLENQVRNLQEDRITVVQALFEKPDTLATDDNDSR